MTDTTPPTPADQISASRQDAPEPKRRPHKPLLALTFLLGAIIIAPLMDSLMKALTTEVSVPQLTWARYFFHAALFAPFALFRYGPREFLLPAQLPLQLLRGTALLFSSFAFIAAIKTLELADALALVFSESFVVALFAIVFLGETVGWRRWLALVVGFIGVLIVLRPGFGMTSGHLWAFSAGLCFGCYFALSRFLTGSSPTLVTMANTALIGAVVMSIWMLFAWEPLVRPELWLLLILVGLLAGCVHGLFQLAFQNGEASFMAVFAYGEIITAVICGYIFFGDLPDAIGVLGISVIISAGVYLVYRERVAQKRSAL